MPTDAQRSWLASLGVSSAAPLNLPSSRAPATTATGPSAPTPSKSPDKDAVVLPEDTITAKPPTTAPRSLGASVGRGGKNKPNDVMWVQAALNDQGAKLLVDGKCGRQTIEAIKVFQTKLGFRKPDYVVEPGKRTALALAGDRVGPQDESEEAVSAGAGKSPNKSSEAPATKGIPALTADRDQTTGGPSPAARAALATAQKILDRQPEAQDSCVGWRGKVEEVMSEVSAEPDLAEARQIVADLNRWEKEQRDFIRDVREAADALREAAEGEPGTANLPALTEAVQVACDHTESRFEQLSELTDLALQWWGLHATPEWKKKRSATGAAGAKPKGGGVEAGLLEAALKMAEGVRKRGEQSCETGEAAQAMLSRELPGVEDQDAARDGILLKTRLAKSLKDLRDKHAQLQTAVREMESQPSRAAADSVGLACQLAEATLEKLSELTQEALEWQTFNAPSSRANSAAKRGDTARDASESQDDSPDMADLRARALAKQKQAGKKS